MSKYKIVFIHSGENESGSYIPECLFQEFDKCKYKTKTITGNDGKIFDVLLYSIKEVEIPDWFYIRYWIRNPEESNEFFKLLKFMDIKRFDFDNFLKIKDLSVEEKIAVLSLMKTKTFKSSFRESLRNQLNEWFNTRGNTFNSPFSQKQWKYLLLPYVNELKKNFENVPERE